MWLFGVKSTTLKMRCAVNHTPPLALPGPQSFWSLLTTRGLTIVTDMDDTLVLTADADAASHAAVVDVMRTAAPEFDAEAVLEHWKRLFYRAPWDTSHEARRYTPDFEPRS